MKLRVYILGILVLFSFSCSDFLKESSQDLAYVRSYEDLDELLIGSAYLKPEGESYYPYLHLMADETGEIFLNTDYGQDYSGAREAYFGFYTWQKRVNVKPDGTENNVDVTDWDRMYEHINLANMILFEIDKQDADGETQKQAVSRIRGEAHFLRAAYYFWLVNLYGKPYQESTASTDLGVPIKTTEYIEDKIFQRNTVEEVYAQILKDLKQAEENLKDARRKSVYRADITAVYLLRSRVALYMQDWETAKSYARKVLEKNNTLVDMNTWKEGEGGFVSKTSVETIFSMGANHLGEFVSFRVGGFGVSDDLLSQYKDGDLRRNVFFSEEYVIPANIKYTPLNKYLVNVSENFVFRTPEAYLNLAEACACLDDETGARDALNKLRENRFDRAVNQPVEASGEELISIIRDERYRELCFEGHRWFDLRRYSVCKKYPFAKILKHTYSTFAYNNVYVMVPIQSQVYELKPGDPAYVLPIPKEILDYDGMKDNLRNERSVLEVITY